MNTFNLADGVQMVDFNIPFPYLAVHIPERHSTRYTRDASLVLRHVVLNASLPQLRIPLALGYVHFLYLALFQNHR